MTLVKCSECAKEISDKATTCPNCGNPLRTEFKTDTQTIQVTDKRWKMAKVVAVLLFIGGISYFKIGDAEFGWMMVTIAIVLFVASSVGAWWTNG